MWKLALLACLAGSADEPQSYRLVGRNQAGCLVFSRPADGARVVWIPAGPFMQKAFTFRRSQPLHARREQVDGFAIDETEVTNTQYARFLAAVGRDRDDDGNAYLIEVAGGLQHGEDGWAVRDGCDALPALGVTGYGAAAYAAWVGGALPSEAEWQKAAGGLDGQRYPWGEDDPTSELACCWRGDAAGPVAVGSFPAGASPYGVLDMAGNVYERVQSPMLTLPEMIRGGSWASTHPLDLRTTHMSGQPMNAADRTVGFRCVVRAGPGLPSSDEERERTKDTAAEETGGPLAATTAVCPGPDIPTLITAPDWEQAKREAKDRDVPIFLVLLFDACSPCDRILVNLLRDPAFVDFLNEHVVVAIGMIPWDAEDDPHPTNDDGSCPLLPATTCAAHEALWFAGREDARAFRIPPGCFILDPRTAGEGEQAILVGEEQLAKWGGDVEGYTEALRRAQQAIGDGVPRSEWDG